jgi:hypothetical protein
MLPFAVVLFLPRRRAQQNFRVGDFQTHYSYGGTYAGRRYEIRPCLATQNPLPWAPNP